MRSIWGRKGAMCAAYLLLGIMCVLYSPKVQAAEEGIPQPSSARLYRDMSESSNIIANLIVGNVFEVVGSENDDSGGKWYKVRTDFGAEGYVKAGELDRLILDAQAMMESAASSATTENPVPQVDSAGEGQIPEENNLALPEGENNATPSDNPVPSEENSAEYNSVPPEKNSAEHNPATSEANSTEHNSVPSEQDAGHNRTPSNESDAENNPAPEGDNDPMPEENNASASSSQAVASNHEEGDQESDANFVNGAGVGAVDSVGMGTEQFEVIEGTNNTKIQRHNRIDVVLIMIIAGGILCIIAMAALLKKILMCIRTEV